MFLPQTSFLSVNLALSCQFLQGLISPVLPQFDWLSDQGSVLMPDCMLEAAMFMNKAVASAHSVGVKLMTFSAPLKWGDSFYAAWAPLALVTPWVLC